MKQKYLFFFPKNPLFISLNRKIVYSKFFLVIKSKSSVVRSYRLSSIIANRPGETIKPQYQSEQNFHAKIKSSLIVLPDGKTIVGVDPKTEKKIILEDITTNKHTSFGNHTGIIRCLLYDQTTQTLFAGDFKGRVMQYEKSTEDESFVLVEDYGDVGVDAVWSSAQVGEFAIFGGYNGKIMAIDIKNRRRVERSIKTAIGFVTSLEVCKMKNLKMFLSVSGRDPDYSEDKSDFFDLTGLLISDPKIREIFHLLDITKAREVIFEQHMKIRSQEETIARLQKSIKRNDDYKKKLEKAEAEHRTLKEKYQSILTKNQNIRNIFKLLKPKIDEETKILKTKMLMMDKLRKMYCYHLPKPHKFTCLDEEDQSETISELRKEIEHLNDQKSLNLECLQKSIEIQRENIKQAETVRMVKEEMKKQLLDFIKDR